MIAMIRGQRQLAMNGVVFVLAQAGTRQLAKEVIRMDQKARLLGIRVVWYESDNSYDSCIGDVDDDEERKEAFYRGEWSWWGCKAYAEIGVPIGGDSYCLQQLQSMGCWGIASDSGTEYFAEVEQQEIDGLLAQLRIMGVEGTEPGGADCLLRTWDNPQWTIKGTEQFCCIDLPALAKAGKAA